MNYGEEHAYWYLRLNGFFPLQNFVVHRHGGNELRSDVDVLAVRPPLVYEEIGGQQDDWDQFLAEYVPLDCVLGVVCEVKTGAFTADELFARRNLIAATQRLGLLAPAACEAAADNLMMAPSIQLEQGTIFKLLVSEQPSDGPYLNRTIDDIRAFLRSRIERYPHEKFASRHFFPSNLLQARSQLLRVRLIVGDSSVARAGGYCCRCQLACESSNDGCLLCAAGTNRRQEA